MNPTRPNEVILGDILRLALPLKTTIVGGASVARRIIRWVVLLTSWSDLGEQVKEGDLIIVPLHLQEQLTVSDLCSRLAALAKLSIAAVIVFRNVPPTVARSAADSNLPLIITPPEFTVREAHQTIAALLVDRQQATSERAMQLYRRLSEMSREGQGLQAMTDVMSNLTGKIIFVQDKRLEVKAESWPSDTTADQDLLRRVLRKREQLPAILRNRKAAARARQSYWQQILPVENMGRLISPIVAGDRARGYLSVIGPASSLDLLDSLTAEHGAAACALEMAKVKAVSEARKSLRGDFLEGLLAGTLAQEEIDRLAGRLDHDTRPPHAIMTLSWIGEEPPSLRRLETTVNWLLNHHIYPALVHDYGGRHLCVFQALKDPDSLETAHELGRRLLEQLEVEFPDKRLIGGISGPAETLADWPRVYREAIQAMDVGERLQLGNQIVEFNSLGVYQLLCELEGIPAVQRFATQVIGPLIKYDSDHRGSLVQTLEAYFNHHGNISRTAESLFVHRNTLLYRMERIQELTGQDLNNADMRLALHLSLKLWQLRPQAADLS
ncbi:MAG: helix-turn-helix domain-containing protein [Anaerolineaceae bacterium]|nr:MAG: helix-turn-helix domain-containing protein [Anaerolineaceae bacterium]